MTKQWIVKYPVRIVMTKCSLGITWLAYSNFDKLLKMKRCTETRSTDVKLMDLFMVLETTLSRLGIVLWINQNTSGASVFHPASVLEFHTKVQPKFTSF